MKVEVVNQNRKTLEALDSIREADEIYVESMIPPAPGLYAVAAYRRKDAIESRVVPLIAWAVSTVYVDGGDGSPATESRWVDPVILWAGHPELAGELARDRVALVRVYQEGAESLNDARAIVEREASVRLCPTPPRVVA